MIFGVEQKIGAQDMSLDRMAESAYSGKADDREFRSFPIPR